MERTSWVVVFIPVLYNINNSTLHSLHMENASWEAGITANIIHISYYNINSLARGRPRYRPYNSRPGKTPIGPTISPGVQPSSAHARYSPYNSRPGKTPIGPTISPGATPTFRATTPCGCRRVSGASQKARWGSGKLPTQLFTSLPWSPAARTLNYPS